MYNVIPGRNFIEQIKKDEDIKGVIRIWKSKDRQCNSQTKIGTKERQAIFHKILYSLKPKLSN